MFLNILTATFAVILLIYINILFRYKEKGTMHNEIINAVAASVLERNVPLRDVFKCW